MNDLWRTLDAARANELGVNVAPARIQPTSKRGAARGFAAIGLINVKSEINAGGAMRAAHAFGAALVAIHGRRYGANCCDTTSAWKSIPTLRVDDIFSAIPHDCVPVAVEISERAECLTSYVHPERAFYIFGPEDGSVPRAVLDRCRDIVSVPTTVCLNLAACVNVVLYDRAAKRMRRVDG